MLLLCGGCSALIGLDDYSDAPLCNNDIECPGVSVCAVGSCVDGTCVVAHLPNGATCELGQCDGKGECLLKQGDPCDDPTVCASGQCVENRCCETNCDGGCVTCSDPSQPGTCSPIAPGAEDAEACTDPSVCDGKGTCTTGTAAELRSYGDVAPDSAFDVAIHSDGSFAIVGSFAGALDIDDIKLQSADDDTLDGFLAMFEPSGTVRWARSFSGPSSDSARAVTFDADGAVYVVGYFHGECDFGKGTVYSFTAADQDGFIAKYSGAGTPLWAKAIGAGNADRIDGIAADANGNISVAGQAKGAVDFGVGATANTASIAAFVASYDAQGDYNWAVTIDDLDSEYTDFASAVAIDQAGNTLAAINLIGVAMAGQHITSEAWGEYDGLVVMIDSGGVAHWGRRIGGDGADILNGIAAGQNGDVIVTGSNGGSFTYDGATKIDDALDGQALFVARMTPAGDVLWRQRYAGTGSANVGRGVTVDANDAALVVGNFTQELDLGMTTLTNTGSQADGLAIKFAFDGTALWAQQLQDADGAELSGAAMSGTDTLLVGSVYGNASIGEHSVESAGASDIAVVRLTP